MSKVILVTGAGRGLGTDIAREALAAGHHVVSGIALIGTRDGTLYEAHPGETVACPPNEEHWHGAAPDRFMEHIAMWEGTGDDTPETTWAEPITDQQYNGPPHPQPVAPANRSLNPDSLRTSGSTGRGPCQRTARSGRSVRHAQRSGERRGGTHNREAARFWPASPRARKCPR